MCFRKDCGKGGSARNCTFKKIVEMVEMLITCIFMFSQNGF